MSPGETKMEITFGITAETMSEVVKHQAAEWIDMAEAFKKDKPSQEKDKLILAAQDTMKQAAQLLVKAIEL